MNCTEFLENTEQYFSEDLPANLRSDAEAHLHTCSQCAALVHELNKTSELVRTLDRTCAPDGFEARLKARLSAEGMSRSERSLYARLAAACAGLPSRLLGNTPIRHRFTFRPIFATLLLCALIVGSTILATHRSSTEAVDWGYINTCRQQHDDFASANPLADESAVMLRERTEYVNAGF